ncbi:MAG: hypothetical protein ABSC94_32880 [Polyangiaceae bacterium]|jgi:hypothetical protein
MGKRRTEGGQRWDEAARRSLGELARTGESSRNSLAAKWARVPAHVELSGGFFIGFAA